MAVIPSTPEGTFPGSHDIQPYLSEALHSLCSGQKIQLTFPSAWSLLFEAGVEEPRDHRQQLVAFLFPQRGLRVASDT